MQVTIDLDEHLQQTLREFRQLLEKQRGTPASAPMLELQRNYSALSTSAQVLAEALDKAAQGQGL